MKTPLIPAPQIAQRLARHDVRQRWIGSFVRIGRRHMISPHPRHPGLHRIVSNQKEYAARGIGKVLDVGRKGWFYVRWEDGTTEEQHKKDLDFYDDHPTADSD